MPRRIGDRGGCANVETTQRKSIEAEVTNVDPRERRIGLSIKALKRSEERDEVDSYLRRERENSKFSFEDILSEELRLDRDEGDRPKAK